MIAKLQSLLDLPARDRWTLLRAWCLLGVVAVGLRFLSRERMERALRGQPRADGGNDRPQDPYTDALRLHRLVGIASRHHFVDAQCLQRSLVLMHLLRRLAIPARLRIGVRRDQASLEAHAWVEYDGRPLGEAELDFAPLEAAGSPS